MLFAAAIVVLAANGDDTFPAGCGINGCLRRPIGAVFGVLNATVVGTAATMVAVMFVVLKIASQSKSTPSSDSFAKHDHKVEFCVSAL